MQYIDRYPILVTEHFAACRDFWAKHLGFAVIFENGWFVYLQAEGASMAFMSPAHPSSPPGPEPSARPCPPPPPCPQVAARASAKSSC